MMNDTKPKISADVQRLIDMEDEMILARDIAPIIHVKPDVIIKYVKTGQWDADRLGNYVISGDHVKFFRKDFLIKAGFITEEPPDRTVSQALDDLRAELHEIRMILMAQLSIGPLLRLDDLKQKEKTASCCNS